VPTSPDLSVDTSKVSVEKCIVKILNNIENKIYN